MKAKIVIALGLLAAFPQLGLAASGAQVELRQKAPYGNFLADAQGRALYLFTADRGGTSACYDACAQAWPPLVSTSNPQAGAGVPAGMLGVIQRRDGTRQVTYDGKPLYYFVGDTAAGSTAGEDVDHFGGSWYLVSPKGAKIEKDEDAQSSGSKW